MEGLKNFFEAWATGPGFFFTMMGGCLLMIIIGALYDHFASDEPDEDPFERIKRKRKEKEEKRQKKLEAKAGKRQGKSYKKKGAKGRGKSKKGKGKGKEDEADDEDKIVITAGIDEEAAEEESAEEETA